MDRRNGFQYPVSDRMGCNEMVARLETLEDALSVSCVGSNGLQRGRRDDGHRAGPPFSILCRIEWAATSLPSPSPLVGGYFQYPVSDRMGCNLTYASCQTAGDPPFSILCRIEWAAT